jgi:hypothetical protein
LQRAAADKNETRHKSGQLRLSAFIGFQRLSVRFSVWTDRQCRRSPQRSPLRSA